jgi:hypothetical protein
MHTHPGDPVSSPATPPRPRATAAAASYAICVEQSPWGMTPPASTAPRPCLGRSQSRPVKSCEEGFVMTDQLPPIVVVRGGVLVDGYHRWQAHVREGIDTIAASLALWGVTCDKPAGPRRRSGVRTATVL